MKYIIPLFIFIVSYSSFSQSPIIKDGTWYLHNLIINSEEHPFPINSANRVIDGTFSTLANDKKGFNTWVCDTMECSLDFDSENPSFSIISKGITLGGCTFDANIVSPQLVTDFEIKWYNFFNYGNIYSYEIIEETSTTSQTLIITDANGNKAIFNNAVLSTNEFSNLDFSIYPIPAKEELNISSTINLENLKFTIFDLSGKVIAKEQKVKSKPINIENLSKGVYFLQIKSNIGNVVTKRFVK
ncbi:T9SS type A sorting domain-containing protein [Flavivirga eckloniae]|uniref:Secretion system C-terminal sorting domain-containing protein n=1 Tax=Flavivirga eckloniae TaxID=1803846 RepID=A0A2K9PK57_9FLAO|nr:T9SS type A sorting domain-containing protein [Flavivirga eckloniae]AUP77415.1 hypothetical protein C1H87_01240 [Flavivirga eckloniae]